MAVKFNTEFKVSDKYSFWPEDLKVSPELNGRRDLPDISDLIADIEVNGQHTPVVIRSDGGTPVLAFGFSRWRAIVDINKRSNGNKRKIVCVYEALTEQEAFKRNVTENKFRNDTTEIDDAHNIKRMLQVYKWSEEEIALIYFPNAKDDAKKKEAVKWVKKRIALIGLTEEAAQAVRKGRVKVTAAAEIAKLTAEQQKKVVSGDGKIKGSDVRKASGKQEAPSIKQRIQHVIETGKFHVNGKEFAASDAMVEFMSSLIASKSTSFPT